MSAQVVSLLQIAALLVCPMSCGAGYCADKACCGTIVQDSTDAGQASENSRGCCQPKPDREADHRSPIRRPESSCQGICGGAVFQKPVELNIGTAWAFACLADQTVLVSQSDLELRTPEAKYLQLLRGGNQGRLLRTRLMSFLC